MAYVRSRPPSPRIERSSAIVAELSSAARPDLHPAHHGRILGTPDRALARVEVAPLGLGLHTSHPLTRWDG
jgi:hypothetical protein